MRQYLSRVEIELVRKMIDVMVKKKKLLFVFMVQ